MKNRYNILFFVLFFLCLCVHFLFAPLHIIKDRPLEGYYKTNDSIHFSPEAYFTHSYQDSTEKYIDYKFGLFPGFTRIHHQMEYSLFGKVNVRDVHRGKDGYLFRYVDGYFDKKTYEANKLKTYIGQYARFSDSLKAAGKNVIWVIAPDKNIVYSEFLGDSVKHGAQINNFYYDLKAAFSQQHLPFLDFNAVALSEKNKYPYAVCNKGGVHWTQAYSARCFDSLCAYLRQNSSIAINNTITLKKVNTPWGPDIDIEAAANLLAPLEKGNNYFADLTSASNAKNKKLLLIGDSFCHAWAWNQWLQSCFDPGSEFWYYNREAHQLDDSYLRDLDHQHVRDEVKGFDTFIILFSAGNVEMLDYGFVGEVYR